MIKIDKDQVPCPDYLNEPHAQAKREALIQLGTFPSQGYSEVYKGGSHRSVFNALKVLYHYKCAYCETEELSSAHVEHYRPKSKYPWLAYSWDNLLLACAKCNGTKKDEFDLEGEKAEYQASYAARIHALRDELDALEKPLMVNPEKEEVGHLITYDLEDSFEMSAQDHRVSYTIKKCGLKDREELILKRRQILASIKEKLHDRALAALRLKATGNQEQAKEAMIKALGFREDFAADSLKPETPYSHYRQYLLKHHPYFAGK